MNRHFTHNFNDNKRGKKSTGQKGFSRELSNIQCNGPALACKKISFTIARRRHTLNAIWERKFVSWVRRRGRGEYWSVRKKRRKKNMKRRNECVRGALLFRMVHMMSLDSRGTGRRQIYEMISTTKRQLHISHLIHRACVRVGES